MDKETVDIEDYFKQGKDKPGHHVVYKYRVDKKTYESEDAEISREKILEAAGLNSNDYELYVYKKNERLLVNPGETINLAEKGVERFSTIPKHMTEG